MIDLILDIVLLDEQRLKRRIAGFLMSLLVPLLLVLLSVIWISFAIYEVMLLNLTSLQAAGVMVVALVAMLAVSLALLLRPRKPKQSEDLIDALVSALAGRRDTGERGRYDDLAALILLVASQVQRRGDKRP